MVIDITIMVTEAKKHGMDQGVTRCATDLDSAAILDRKRKRGQTGSSVLYCIILLEPHGPSQCGIHKGGSLSIRRTTLQTKDRIKSYGGDIDSIQFYFGNIQTIPIPADCSALNQPE